MSAILVYFILSAAGKWEFLAIERVPDQAYCEALKTDVASVYQGKQGNFRIVCADDRGFEL